MISIIIPVYNVANYLSQCLNSVIAQKYKNWECILIDDGSTDDSGHICDNYSQIDNRITTIHQTNQGVSAARNTGIKYANRQYITFVDSDDWIDENYLDTLLKGLETQTELVASGLIQEFSDTTRQIFAPKKDYTFQLDEEHTRIFVEMNRLSLFYGPVAKLYKYAIIKKHHILFPENCSYGEDLIFNYRYLGCIKEITCISAANYHYRIIGSGTLSSRFRPDQFETDYSQWKILRIFYQQQQMWNKISQEYLYQKLWGIVYDGIFGQQNIQKNIIDKIINIPEHNELIYWEHTFSCAKWIKKLFQYKCSHLLYLIIKGTRK
ncbi:glycosyltransferase family 2 protein [uncultured Phocaeicola sp.]|uniref:glycosyltransferase family 2 protein n=1 Tax=uncultured Phocaeicola sp. TaxID=990718 RepID=UPI00259838D9|nr:glycosyltransferase family 2 protein [uncultured Phocaeicola sp.]